MYVSAKRDSQEEIVKPLRLFPAYGNDPKPIQREWEFLTGERFR